MKNLKFTKTADKKHGKRIVGRIVKCGTAFLGTAILLSVTLIQSHNTALADASSDAFGMKIELYEWNRIYDVPTKDFYGCFVWGPNDNHYFSGGRQIGGSKNSDGRWDYWLGVKESTDPYLNFNSRTFITRDSHDPSLFHYKGKRGEYLGYAGMYSIELFPQLNEEMRKCKWVGTYKNAIQGKTSESTWDILDYHDNRGVKTKNMKKASTATAKGCVRMQQYFGEEKCCPVYTDGNYISVHKRDDWPTCDMMLFSVEKKTYNAMSDYTISNGNIFRNQDSSFLLDGKTLTIPEGSVLSVKGTFYYNGTINCAGTIIVEEGARMLPFNPNMKAGEINLQNGGTLIIMPKGRVVAGLPAGTLNAKENAWLNVGTKADSTGTIINYGLLVSGNTNFGPNATIEMHDGSRMFLGYVQNRKLLNFIYNDFNGKSYSSEVGVVLGGLTNIQNPKLYMYGTSSVTMKGNDTNSGFDLYSNVAGQDGSLEVVHYTASAGGVNGVSVRTIENKSTQSEGLDLSNLSYQPGYSQSGGPSIDIQGPKIDVTGPKIG